jgi:hypothetical protein
MEPLMQAVVAAASITPQVILEQAEQAVEGMAPVLVV